MPYLITSRGDPLDTQDDEAVTKTHGQESLENQTAFQLWNTTTATTTTTTNS